MKVKYEYVNSEVVEIEVDEKWAEILKELDKEEARNNHTETRRHSHLGSNLSGEWCASSKYDPYMMIDKEYDEEIIRAALDNLNDNQKRLVEKVFILGMSIKRFAEMEGVSPAAICQRIKTIRKKIENFLI